jgi:hypothetical protein
VPHALLLIAQLDVLGDLGGWFEEVWDQIRSIDVKYLILGCTLQTVQTVLNGLAWRNILAESYGHGRRRGSCSRPTPAASPSTRFCRRRPGRSPTSACSG